MTNFIAHNVYKLLNPNDSIIKNSFRSDDNWRPDEIKAFVAFQRWIPAYRAEAAKQRRLDEPAPATQAIAQAPPEPSQYRPPPLPPQYVTPGTSTGVQYPPPGLPFTNPSPTYPPTQHIPPTVQNNSFVYFHPNVNKATYFMW